jgi:hypothetical protein
MPRGKVMRLGQDGVTAVFANVYGAEKDTAKITLDPVWRAQARDRARRPRLYEVSDGLWMLGLGHTAADGILVDQ